MMNTRINRWSLVLWATALGAALAGCSDGQSVVGGPGDAAVANDLAAEAATDAPVDVPVDAGSPMDIAMDVAMDAPMDVAMDAPMDTRTGSAALHERRRLQTNPGRGACDTATGMCVQCVASSDTCPATEHCNGATNTCEPGCRSDDGAVPGQAAPLPAPAATDPHTCVSAPPTPTARTLCVGSVCARAAPSAARGQSCCSGACVDGQTNLAHCGRCDNRCSVANAMPLCLNGTCGVGACNAPFGDCDSSGANGCETNTQTDWPTAAPATARARRAPTPPPPAPPAPAASPAPGFSDCDGDASNGCEVNTATSTTLRRLRPGVQSPQRHRELRGRGVRRRGLRRGLRRLQRQPHGRLRDQRPHLHHPLRPLHERVPRAAQRLPGLRGRGLRDLLRGGLRRLQRRLL
ncbi:MAG: hypothetical protein IPN17_29375 [Deltaproteobacteria bacterium]|nr:hypothetical protein [Deltaproteobacteria bacterium]